MIYEHLKKLISFNKDELSLLDCMGAAGVAKFTASSLCYPHGVLICHARYVAYVMTPCLLYTCRGGQDKTASESIQRSA